MFLALQSDQETQKERQNNFDALGWKNLQKIIGHEFFFRPQVNGMPCRLLCLSTESLSPPRDYRELQTNSIPVAVLYGAGFTGFGKSRVAQPTLGCVVLWATHTPPIQ